MLKAGLFSPHGKIFSDAERPGKSYFERYQGNIAPGRVIAEASVFFKILHPFGPHRHSGTGQVLVPFPVPVNSPQLFEPGFTNGEIQEQAVDKAVVPVVAETAHIIALAGVELPVEAGRFVPYLGPAVEPVSSEEKGDIPAALDISIHPVLMFTLSCI